MRLLIILYIALSAIADVSPDLQPLTITDDLADSGNPNIENPIDLSEIALGSDDSQRMSANPGDLNVDVPQSECEGTVDQFEDILDPSVGTRRSRRKRGAACSVQSPPSREKAPELQLKSPPASPPTANPCNRNDRYLSCAGPEGTYFGYLAVADCLEGKQIFQRVSLFELINSTRFSYRYPSTNRNTRW